MKDFGNLNRKYSECAICGSVNHTNKQHIDLQDAAPELLEACKILNQWAENNHLIGTKDEPPGIAEAQAAIAKAEKGN